MLRRYIPGVGNHTVFRAFRVLRPLRTLGKVPGMRQIINTMGEASDALADVVLLTTFIFLIFSVRGRDQGWGWEW